MDPTYTEPAKTQHAIMLPLECSMGLACTKPRKLQKQGKIRNQHDSNYGPVTARL